MTRELKIDQVVTTADGTLHRVCSVWRGEAELEDPVTGVRVTLPVTELRRVADPRNRRPPVTGVPDERPRCATCDKPHRMVTRDTYTTSRAPWAPRLATRAFIRWSSYRGLFCTLTCALTFAQAAHQAGYRIVR